MQNLESLIIENNHVSWLSLINNSKICEFVCRMVKDCLLVCILYFTFVILYPVYKRVHVTCIQLSDRHPIYTSLLENTQPFRIIEVFFSERV